MTHLKKFEFNWRTHIASKKNSKKGCTSPPFWGKTHFFKKIFKSRYLDQLFKILITVLKQPLQPDKSMFCPENFLFIQLFWKFDSLRNQKCGIAVFLKKGLFSEFREQIVISLNSTFESPYQKKIKKKLKIENEFLADFYFIFLFFFLKNFFIFKIFEK